MLTPAQRRLVEFLLLRDREGVTPSYREMAKELRLSSISAVHRLVLALEERGFVRRIPNRARAIEVIRAPSGDTHHAVLADKVSGIAAAGFKDPETYAAALAALRTLAASHGVEFRERA